MTTDPWDDIPATCPDCGRADCDGRDCYWPDDAGIARPEAEPMTTPPTPQATAETEHGNIPLYRFADSCDHPEPTEPDSDHSTDDSAWRAYDEWHDDHQTGREGEPLCFLTPTGSGCPACTEARDLPEGEYILCQLPSGSGEGAPTEKERR
jgi:hypothetical protein